MDTAQSSHEKRSIKVKDFLQDFRCGMPDRDLMEKYELSTTGLEKFYNMLLDRNIIDYAEFEERVEEVVSADCEVPLSIPDAQPVSQDDEVVAASAPEMEVLPGEATANTSEVIAEDAPASVDQLETLQVESSPLDEPAVGDISEDLLNKLETEWLESLPTHAESSDETRFICPSCLYSQGAAFETCPDCGISLSEFFENNVVQPLDSNTIELWSDPELVFAEAHAHDTNPENELVFTDQDLFPRPENDLKTAPEDLETRPIEIPESEVPLRQQLSSSQKAVEHEDFFYSAEPPRLHSAFAEAFDEMLPTFPIEDGVEDKTTDPRCEHCRDTLEPEVRRIYDRRGAMSAFAVAVISLVLGCVGAAALAIFDEYSLFRVLLIYGTGLTMLLGTVFLGLALFMLFFAREKVYVCAGCHRTYPRL